MTTHNPQLQRRPLREAMMAAMGKPAAEPVAAGGRAGARSRGGHLLAWLTPVVLLCTTPQAESETWVLDADSAEHVQVAMAPDGRAVVVWTRYPSDARRPRGLFARRLVPGVGFSPAVQITSIVGQHGPARLALDAFGNAFVTWRPSYGGDPRGVWACRLDWAEGWQEPEMIDQCRSQRCHVEDPQVAATPDGAALVVWSVVDVEPAEGSRKSVWARRFVAGRGWDPPQQIDRGDIDVDYVRVAAGWYGFLVAWRGGYSGRGEWPVRARWLDQHGGWGEEKELSSDGFDLAVAMAERGSGLVAWRQDDGYAVGWLDPEAGWQGAVTLFQEFRYWGGSFDVVVDEYGGAALAWKGRGVAWVSRLVPGLGWQEPFELRPRRNEYSVRVSVPALAGNAAGEIAVVWYEWDADAAQAAAWWRRWNGLTGWSSARLLGSGEDYFPWVSAAMDGEGDALVAWTLGGRLEARLRQARLVR